VNIFLLNFFCAVNLFCSRADRKCRSGIVDTKCESRRIGYFGILHSSRSIGMAKC